MRNFLLAESLILGAVLFVGANACAPAPPTGAPPTLTAVPTVASVASPVPKASAPAKPAASPSSAASPAASPRAAASVVLSPSVFAVASPSPAIAAQKPPNVSLTIMSPAAGETVSPGSVMVSVNYMGPPLVEAANATKLDDYHLHYLLDVDPKQYIGTLVAIPLGNPQIIHSAATTVRFENVAAGTHTLAVILGGSNHISVTPPVADEETFTAR
jgi:hypothetical protein